MNIETTLAKARTRLLLSQPWFGSLLLRLKMQAEPNIKTFDVDGTTLRYNPQFVESLMSQPTGMANLIFVLAHEVMHCAMLHMYRRGSRDPKGWNEAADYAINGILVKAGLQMPTGGLIDATWDNMSAEQIYAKRHHDNPQDANKPSNDPNGKDGMGNCPTGSFTDAPKGTDNGQGNQQTSNVGQPGQGTPKPANGPMTESDWQIVAEQANNAASKAGQMSSDLAREIKKTRESITDWRQVLRQYVSNDFARDYTWSKPNRRHLPSGLYLPSIYKENLGEIVFAADSSGSITPATLSAAWTELVSICRDAKPSKLHAISCSTVIQELGEYTADTIPDTAPAMRTGGTYFQPVFDWVANKAIEPRVLVYFTDLECFDQPTDPGYPVLWLTPEWINTNGPFGETARVTI